MPRLPGLSSRGLSLNVPKAQQAQELHSQAIDEMLQNQSSVDQDGTDQITPDVIQTATNEADLQQKYGDTSGTAILSGLADGTIPGAEQIATKVLGVDPKLLQRAKEQHPYLHGAAEAGALVGGAVLTGGENLAAEGAAAGTEAAEGANALASGAQQVSKYTLGGLSTLGSDIFKTTAEKNFARRIVEKGIGEAAVGAGFGINQLINENALGNADLTGENMVAYAGSGAVLNGLVGGAFGAGEELSPIAKQAIDSSTEQLKKTFGKFTDPIQNLAELVSKGKATQDIVQDIGKAGITPEEIGNHIQNRMGLGIEDSRSTIASKLETARTNIGNDLDSAYKKVDELSNGNVVPTYDMQKNLLQSLQDYKNENPNLFDYKAGKNAYEDVQNTVMNRFSRVKGIESAQDAWQLAKDYSTQAGKAFSEEKSSLKEQLFRELNTSARETLTDNIQKMTEGTDLAGAADSIKALNREYRINSILSQGLDNAGSSPAFLSYRNVLGGLAGTMLAGKLGGPVGLAGRALLSSDLKRKFLVLNMAERANLQGAKKITEGLGDFFTGAAKAGTAMAKALPKMSLMNSGWAVNEKNRKPQNEQEAFGNISKNLVSMSVDPDKLATKIAYNTMRAGYAAPNATKFAQVALGNAVQFLYSKMPKDGVAGQSLFPQEFKPSTLELAKFQRYVQAVENPYSVLAELKSGTLTHEHVEALQAVYPAIYNEVRTQTMDYVQKHQDLSYSKKVQLGTLLNLPVDPSMQPQAVLGLQKAFQPPQPASSPQGASGAIRSTAKGMQGLKFNTRHATELENIASGANKE